MTRKTTVAVDREALAKVLAAIRDDAEAAKEFRWRGAETAFLVTGDNKLVELRMGEIRACIRQDEAWKVVRRDQYRVALKAVFQHLENGAPADDVAAFIEDTLSVEVVPIRVAYELLGLRWSGAPFKLGGATFGLLGQVAQQAGLVIDRELYGGRDADPNATVVVLVGAEAPDVMKAMEPAGWQAEEALDLLASMDYRAMFNHGPAWEMRVGRRCWVWREGEATAAMGSSNPWMRGYPYEPAAYMTRQPSDGRFLAPLDPWLQMAEGDLRVTLRDAYTSLGAAMRRAPDAYASVTRAWTAIETLYAAGKPGSDLSRAARAVANRFKLSVAAGTTTGDPFKLAEFYLLRNDIVHGEYSFHWSQDEVGEKLGPLYRHVDRFAAFCIAEGFASRDELQNRLMEKEVVAKARSWVESWTSGVRYALEHGVLRSVKRRRGNSLEFCHAVLKACGPPGPAAIP